MSFTQAPRKPTRFGCGPKRARMPSSTIRSRYSGVPRTKPYFRTLIAQGWLRHVPRNTSPPAPSPSLDPYLSSSGEIS